MSVSRGTPPDIEGYEFVDLIGEGGFADVFRYRQQMPSREVAIKVLVADAVAGATRELFDAEANVMAQLSSHPSIVPIYHAGVAADGRPYLVMEYCPPPTLATRLRREPLAVEEVLEIMVRVSAAVETAHRAGILHRDIKPHNILVNAYGAPMLTDFGIAAAVGDAPGAEGVSVPWSPPEAFGPHPPADPRSDVYSLGATAFSLLAGRSPFEIPGGDNDAASLMDRIERRPPTPLGRADVGQALLDVLDRSMSRQPADRYPSALAFAHALQAVQRDLGLTETRIDVLDASPTARAEEDTDQRTRVRPVSIIVPEALSQQGTRLRPLVVPQPDQAPPRSAEPAPDTVARGPRHVVDDEAGSHFLVADPAPARRPVLDEDPGPGGAKIVIGIVAAVAVLAIVGLALAFGVDRTENDVPDIGASSELPNPISDAPSRPENLAQAVAGEQITFTWEAPRGEAGDEYRVFVSRDGGPVAVETTEDLQVSLPIADGEIVCAQVEVIRGSVGSGATEPALCGSR